MTLNYFDLDVAGLPAAATSADTGEVLDVARRRLAPFDVISFDIFETLLRREGVFRPIDLFLTIGEKAGRLLGLSATEFARLRMRGERDARCALEARRGREVTLAEIYGRMNALLPTQGCPSVSQTELIDAQRLEQEIELEHLRPVPSVEPIYHWAVGAGKRVVLVSDFYSSAEFINKALARSGYEGHERLFVSCDINHTKHHGDLYAHVCEEMGVTSRQIAHVGDNPWSDGSRALQAGITHLRIANPAGRLVNRWRIDWRSPSPQPSSPVFANVADDLFGSGIAPRDPEDIPVLQRVGREALGPLLFGMAGWLHEGAQANETPVLHFCSRDGLIMKRAFDLFRRRFGTKTDSRYLMVSRQAIYRARAVSEPEAAAALFAQNWARLTPADALARWGLDPRAFEAEVRAAGFSSPQDVVAIGDRVGAGRFVELFEACRAALQAANEAHAHLFADYLAQEGVIGAQAVTLVDIGWHGSLQKGLDEVLRARGWRGHLAGRYLGLFLDRAALSGFDAAGYLFSVDGTPRAQALRRSPSLVELLHTASHGSTAGYRRDGDGIVAVCEERPDEERQHAEAIGPIQEAALSFVEEMLVNPRLGPGALDPADAFRGLDRLLSRPSADEVEVIGRLRIAANYGATATSTALTDRSPEGYQLWSVG
jgi:FMN phosphatase YigB (HAD superfamily)